MDPAIRESVELWSFSGDFVFGFIIGAIVIFWLMFWITKDWVK